MLVLLSPAKSLDFDTPGIEVFSQPRHLDDSEKLVKKMRTLSARKLRDLMGVSEKIATLNVDRFQQFETPFHDKNAKQSILAFTGDTYRDMGLDSWTADDHAFAQEHVRILSGLYGTLRPLDLIQPYRLEMGTKLATRRGKDLYAFWKKAITPTLNADLSSLEDAGEARVVVNCASQEYFKSVHKDVLDARVITPVFRDWKNGKYKIISFFAKRARGAMASWIVRNRVSDPEQLKAAGMLGYEFSDAESDGDTWVYLRRLED